MSQVDITRNGGLGTLGRKYRIMGYERDAGNHFRRHYSSQFDDKHAGKFTNKVPQIFCFFPLVLHFFTGNFIFFAFYRVGLGNSLLGFRTSGFGKYTRIRKDS